MNHEWRNGGLAERRYEDHREHRADDRKLHDVIGPVVPSLDPAAELVHLVEISEGLVDDADALPLDVVGGRSLDEVRADPAVDRGHEPVLHRPLDIAEQDDARLVGRVLGAMNERLIEQKIFTVAPDAFDAVNEHVTPVRVRRNQPEMVAQRSGEWVAVIAELRAGRQQCEHCAMHAGDRVQELYRLRAGLASRRQSVLVPLALETLPAASEERVSA